MPKDQCISRLLYSIMTNLPQPPSHRDQRGQLVLVLPLTSCSLKALFFLGASWYSASASAASRLMLNVADRYAAYRTRYADAWSTGSKSLRGCFGDSSMCETTERKPNELNTWFWLQNDRRGRNWRSRRGRRCCEREARHRCLMC
jgi:hypothetical protein